MSRVGVVIPACNGERTIGACLTSVLEQTYRDFEIVIVDDASNDGTIRLVNRYVNANSHARIRLIQLPNRVGTCTTRNIGCGEARGEYIAFIDQDDRWEADKLELQVRYLDRHQESAELFADLRAVDSSGHRLDFTACEGHKHSPSWEDLLLLHPVYPSASLIRRQAFFDAGGFNPQFVLSGAYGDQEVHLRIRERWPIIYADQIVGSYCWDIERPSRIESFLVNLPIYAKICWDSREQTSLRSLDLQKRFVDLCHSQYLYYANLLLGRCYADLTDHQLDLIASARSKLLQIFGSLYSELTGMRQVSLPESSSPSSRLLAAVFLLSPDLQKEYPKALNGDYEDLIHTLAKGSVSGTYGRMLSHFGRKWREDLESKRLSSSTPDLERWLHTPNWHLVRSLAGKDLGLLENPDDPELLSDAKLLSFVRPRRPVEVSIVIPSHNRTGYLLNCLKSIEANTQSLSGRYEVVVVDNGSKDPDFEIFSKVAGLRIVRLDENKGFVEGCNAGAKVARGRHLVFLNNDVMVTPGWLESLIRTMGAQRETGAVGAKLVYPSGRLQEAGCIVWSSGMCHNYGRGDDPSKPDYNYRREVDYCSAACLMVRRELFMHLGGFDPEYSPGYYEDVDLCFSIRKEGRKVLYEPRSVAIHFEGVTGGRDTKFGIKRYQVINRKKFVRKWAPELRAQPQPGYLLRGRDRRARNSVLIVERRVPEPDKNSGDNRLRYLMQMLWSHGFQVTVFADDNVFREPYVDSLRDSGFEVIYDQRLDQLLKERANFYDIIWLSRPTMGSKYIDLVKQLSPSSRVLFDMCDLASLREMRWGTVTGDKSLLVISEETKARELYVARRSDMTIAISEREKAIILQEESALRVEVLPNVHLFDPTQRRFKDRHDLLFLGGFEHAPNVDGLFYFLNSIFDQIRTKLPDLNLIVIGSDMPARIRNLKHEGVKIVGYVEDLRPYFDSCRVFVAPLRFGAGIKGKIGLSMAFGLPVVTTSIGAEGMGLEHQTNVLVSNDPREFAAQVVALYTERQLWYRLRRNAQRHMRLRYAPKEVQRALFKILKELSHARPEEWDEGTPTVLRQELIATRQQLTDATIELAIIRSSLLWAILRFLAPRLDSIFPAHTVRGEFRETVIASLQMIRDQGWKSFFRKAIRKIRRREFTIRR